MAPQRARPSPGGTPTKNRTRPSSGNVSPTKPPPRTSGDGGGQRRHSSSPQKRRPSGSPEKRHSATAALATGGGAAVDPEKRRSHQSEKRRSYASERIRDRNGDGAGGGGGDGGRGPEKRRSAPPSPQKRHSGVRAPAVSATDTPHSSNTLSLDSLAKLDVLNEKQAAQEKKERKKERDSNQKVVTGRVIKERMKHRHQRRTDAAIAGEQNRQSRALRGGDGGGGGGWSGGKGTERRGFLPRDRKKRRCLFLLAGFAVLLLVILVPVGVLVVGRQNSGGDGDGDGSSSSDKPPNGNLGGISENDIPSWAKGGYLDPFTWYDTMDFNVTFTNATVGGIPIMGLNDTWDDSVQANPNVPALQDPFKYGSMPIRGVNVGGWLSLEPFITPSLFDSYDSKLNIVDEWTLTSYLGSMKAAQTLEQHYSSFINKQTFADIRNAGFDHVRIPYSYWAVTTYNGDPYVPKISWRYLIRGIEYCRQNGLRVNLDLHGLPGSQNGWNHSGRQGAIGWLNGTDGDLNGQRSLDLHKQLATFFAQPRYKNVVGIYGLVNEPKMISLPTNTVIAWTTKAVDTVRQAGLKQTIAFGDGFLGLPKWQGQLQGLDNLVLDAHQYVIFNTDQIAFDHKTKLNFACSGWTGEMKMSINPASGFGPTLCGEWSQADTDCTQNLNNVGVGSRWEGTLNLPDPSSRVLTPSCSLKNAQCSCDGANADPGSYTADYKRWLRMNAEAQMVSFETGWGWFYWTWMTESAAQWSWDLGMKAGILPDKVWDRDYNCSSDAPDFPGLPESY